MSVRSSYRRLPVDGAMVLQPDGSGSISAPTASQNNVGLDVLGSFWTDKDVSNARAFLVQGNVSAISETATFAVQVASDAAFTVPVTVASVPIGGAGSFSIGVDRDDVAGALNGAGSGFLRLLATPGTSVTYTAFVAP
jgi:hypothetical protein